MADEKIAVSLDLRGESWPYPAMYAKASLAKMKTGEVLEVISDQMCTLESLPDAVFRSGNKVLAQETQANGLFRYLFQKT